MDYVLGSVAALISGNVTPNRPKVLKRALTPMKHQPSPNVTPKSESVTDRSIFLSPTMQKKKAIVKKSPKRIFQNPDLEVTSDKDCLSSITSPNADKVKKHLKDELEADIPMLSPKSPKNKKSKSLSSQSKKQLNVTEDSLTPEEIQLKHESTPKKKKKKLNLLSESAKDVESNMDEETSSETNKIKKRKKSKVITTETIESNDTLMPEVNESSLEESVNNNKKLKKKSKKLKEPIVQNSNLESDESTVNKENQGQVKQNKNKNRKNNTLKNVLTHSAKKSKDTQADPTESSDETDHVNPNAITNQDSDSEHESDDEIQSENEESNEAVLDTGPQESSDEEEEPEKKIKKKDQDEVKEYAGREEEVKRTLFVGNVPFSSKCKKEIKKIFSKYGKIETVRIRTVPVKDGSMTPKLAVIKKELHPERSTVNVYVKFEDASSVNDALAENNTVLNERHLRVSRSDSAGADHDPRCSVFVGNVPFALEDDALRAKFQNCGEIDSVRIVRDRRTNAGKGFGYVNFASKDGVELALALTEEDLTIKNRILRVKRCTQLTTNQQGRQRNNQGQNNQGRQDNPRRQNYPERQNNPARQGYPGRQNNPGRQNYPERQNNPGRNQYEGRQQSQGRQFNHRGANNREPGDRFKRNQFGNDRFQGREQRGDDKSEGAYRRIMKRKTQESGEGPPQKRGRNLNQPDKEKKQRKEFVGMTADKKKFQKRKLNKDQMKKKALGEILTKRRQ